MERIFVSVTVFLTHTPDRKEFGDQMYKTKDYGVMS